MPCEVVPLRVDFSKMAAIAMETAKMLRLLAKQKLMKLDRNNIHAILEKSTLKGTTSHGI
jgi:hypothetical protein